ncbi:hypothetical protein PF003_g21098 [Phytophthora fragariae]|nr:hypothetical protein PF003_g21098 [Phytophthora fragariae]
MMSGGDWPRDFKILVFSGKLEGPALALFEKMQPLWASESNATDHMVDRMLAFYTTKTPVTKAMELVSEPKALGRALPLPDVRRRAIGLPGPIHPSVRVGLAVGDVKRLCSSPLTRAGSTPCTTRRSWWSSPARTKRAPDVLMEAADAQIEAVTAVMMYHRISSRPGRRTHVRIRMTIMVMRMRTWVRRPGLLEIR